MGGGLQNVSNGDSSTVGGGQYNDATGNYATVAGGQYNTASSTYSTIAGGGENYAGDYATVGGGYGNTASGTFSFAAGYTARAGLDYSFVWNDRYEVGASTAANQVRFYFGGNGSTCYVDGSNTEWNCSSDRALKENFVEVDNVAILEALVAMPVLEYSMKAGDPAVRHIGPVSQDFHAAFQLGGDEKTINSGDKAGITMAAVKGLYTLLQEKEAVIKTLQNEMEVLKGQVVQFRQAALDREARNAALEARMDRLEQTLAPRTAQISLEVK